MEKPVGYLYLLQKYNISKYIPNYVSSYIGPKHYERVDGRFQYKEQHFPAQYQPSDSLGDHLEFALKYEGTNLHLLCAILSNVPEDRADASIIFHPYILAVIVSYTFVFIHPFEDGNGRIHRFLLHDILHRFNFTPTGIIFPISATLLRNKQKYDQMLESVSEPILSIGL
jgi:Fic family protein